MRSWTAVLSSLLVSFGASGCNPHTSPAPPPASSPVPTAESPNHETRTDAPAPTNSAGKPSLDSIKKLAASSNAFGFDLYAKLRAKQQTNIVISPASISTALAMTRSLPSTPRPR
jgi:Serpin (serine protease inhibitor)